MVEHAQIRVVHWAVWIETYGGQEMQLRLLERSAFAQNPCETEMQVGFVGQHFQSFKGGRFGSLRLA